MSERSAKIEKLFWIFLFISPLMDLINGIRMYLAAGGIGGMLSTLNLQELPGLGPSLIVRILFLALMLVFLFLRKTFRGFWPFLLIALCWGATLLCELRSGAAVDWKADWLYMARFCYCLLVLLSYSILLENRRGDMALKRSIDRILCAGQGLLALGVVLPFLFGAGFYTYADPLGYRGCRGFFYAGNDITASLLLLMPLTLCEYIAPRAEDSAKRLSVLCALSAVTLAAMLLIGTKTSFVAIAVIWLAFLCYAVCRAFAARETAPLLRLLAALAATVLVLLLLKWLGRADPFETIFGSIRGVEQYTDIVDIENGRGVETILLSGRTGTLRQAWAEFVARLPLSALFGIGRGTQSKIIEMDLFEVLLYYGLCGAASMLWIYVKKGLSLLLALLRARALPALAGLLSLGLCAGYLLLAGHVLFSTTAGFFFSFVMAYALTFLTEERAMPPKKAGSDAP